MDIITTLYSHVDVFLLFFCRIFFAFQIFPIMEETKLPNAAKVGLSNILALVAFFAAGTPEITYNNTFLGLMLLVAKEAVIGLIMGFCIIIFFQVYYFFGQLLSVQSGLGMSTLYDPSSGAQIPLVGKFYYLGFCATFLISGGLHWFIQALVESFIYIPVGEAVLRAEIMYTIIEAVSLFFLLGIKLASPILAVLFSIDCGLGILARTVPQMNMFVVGLPIKLLVLLVMLMVTIGLFSTFNQWIFNYMVDAFFEIIQGLMP